MISTSIPYFIFTAITITAFYISPVKFRTIVLAVASLIFYMLVKPSYGLLILTLILCNYYLGLKIGETSDKKFKKKLMNFSLFINLGILIYFKYWEFILDNTFLIFSSNTFFNSLILKEIVLPIGLSYYIFQLIGYILDIYRGAVKPEIDFPKFSLFILFFPKLFVGPIERAKKLLPQLVFDQGFQKDNFVEGGRLIAWGLFKKLVVADRIAIYVDAVYSNMSHHNSTTFFVATLLYPFQVYADFSGYTDIAIGTAKLFGIDLIDNFRRPLLAKNVSDFWRRWHISLSSWVNDYIYNPIVYKRRDWGNFGVGIALLVSFVVIGVWHGASWNFVIFGILQATALIYEVVTRNLRRSISKNIPGFLYSSVSIALTFLFFAFSLIVFRTTDWEDASTIVKVILAGNGKLFIDQPSTIINMLIGISVMMFVDIVREYKIWSDILMDEKKWVLHHLGYALVLIYILMAGVFDGGQFIYFAF